jgi:hypothetical protein
MAQKFRCKTCGSVIIYKEGDDIPVYQMAKDLDVDKSKSKKVRKYLECKKHHWHWYEVTEK